MTRTYRSAGAVVVSTSLERPEVLLLDQVRRTGECQVVAPKGRIELGESPVVAAAREVAEESGLHEVRYVAYLGRQAYGFTDDDGAPAEKTVEWFLFATDSQVTTAAAAEGFVGARWYDLDDAQTAVSHHNFGEYLQRATEVVNWRRAALGYSAQLSDAIWSISQQASALFDGELNAGLGLCGSGARGDFVDGWSDLDLIAWGVQPRSPLDERLRRMLQEVGEEHGIATSLRLADLCSDHHPSSMASLVDMKLRAVLGRRALDLALLAGAEPPAVDPVPALGIGARIEELKRYAEQRQVDHPASDADRVDRARRTLSVLCSAGRQLATSTDSQASLRLPSIAVALADHAPMARAGQLITAYDVFRRTGASDPKEAEALAAEVPTALDELVRLLARSETLGDGGATR